MAELLGFAWIGILKANSRKEVPQFNYLQSWKDLENRNHLTILQRCSSTFCRSLALMTIVPVPIHEQAYQLKGKRTKTHYLPKQSWKAKVSYICLKGANTSFCLT